MFLWRREGVCTVSTQALVSCPEPLATHPSSPGTAPARGGRGRPRAPSTAWSLPIALEGKKGK